MGARFAIALLCLAGVAAAEPLDVKTAIAVDADVHGEWLAAVAAYREAIGEGKGTAFQRIRLSHAERMAKKTADSALRLLIKTKRQQWAVDAAAEISNLLPNHALARKTLARAEKDGLRPTQGKRAFPARSAANRALAAGRQGPDFMKGEKQIDEAIAFLLASQGKEGLWNSKEYGGRELYDGGVTALALLALLARGSDGLTKQSQAAAERAAEYLKREQDDRGRWAARSMHSIYVTCLATEALAEFGLITGKKKAVRDAVERAVKHLSGSQGKAGGWRYDPGGESDTSVTSRVTLALIRARQLGVAVRTHLLDDAVKYVTSMLDREWGQIGYNLKGGAPARPEGLQDRFPPALTQAMTAAGAIVLAEAQPGHPDIGGPIGLVRSMLPLKRVPDFYYWMEGAHCLRIAEGALPKEWYAAIVAGVAENRAKDGSVRANGPWGYDGGVIYTTAVCVLALSGPYREKRRVRAMVEFNRKGHREVYVPGTSEGTASRILVQKGDRIKLIDHGKMRHGAMQREVGARGFANADRSRKRLLKRSNFACLLARIGAKGKPFAPPIEEAFDVLATGHLEFLVNDKSRQGNVRGWVIEVRAVAR